VAGAAEDLPNRRPSELGGERRRAVEGSGFQPPMLFAHGRGGGEMVAGDDRTGRVERARNIGGEGRLIGVDDHQLMPMLPPNPGGDGGLG